MPAATPGEPAPTGTDRDLVSTGEGRELVSTGRDRDLESTGSERPLVPAGLSSDFLEGVVVVDAGLRVDPPASGASPLDGRPGELSLADASSSASIPPDVRALAPHLQDLYRLGERAQRAGEPHGAEQYWYVLRGAASGVAAIRVRYVLSLVPLGRFHQCAQEIETLLDEQPEALRCLPALEGVYGEAGGVQRDTRDLVTFRRSHPQDLDAAVTMALLSAAGGCLADAIRLLDPIASLYRPAGLLRDRLGALESEAGGAAKPSSPLELP
ncbi:MAG: hypothetical protein AB1486_04405 [Planctomycetota bacterium]